MKLIVENDMRKMELIKEAYDPSKPQTIKLRGVFMQAETQNANSRKYHLEELEKEVEKFKKEKIDTGTALSELEHPEEISINPDRVCARILDLEQDGNNFIGEAVVLASDEKFGIKGTVKGDLLAGLLNYGTSVGFSSRGVGEVGDDGWVTDFQLITIDTVLAPSIGIMSQSNANRFVNGILESKEFIVNTHGEILEKNFESFEKKLKKLPTKQSAKEERLAEAVHDFFKSLI